jgi:hypothetical protein
MSIRRFNYTERQRLNTRDVAIYVEEQGDSRSFDATFDLNRYHLPSTARVIVEAYRQTTVRRYAFGLVANPSAEGPTDLGDFGDSSGVLFRTKVVDATGSGRLLAVADRIHTADPKTANCRALIRVASAPLDGEIWRFSIDPGGPLLEFETKFPRESLLTSPHFICLVYPQVLRELLRRALDEGLDDEDEGSWQSKAVFFGQRLSGKKAPEEDATGDDRASEEWINRAVTAFCKQHHLGRKYANAISGGGDEG